MAKRRLFFFSALGPETEEQIKLAKNKIRFDCLVVSFKKVIRTLAFRGREKFDNSFYFTILGIVW